MAWQLLALDGEIFRVHTETGRTWAIEHDEDDRPQWVEIKERAEETK